MNTEELNTTANEAEQQQEQTPVATPSPDKVVIPQTKSEEPKPEKPKTRITKSVVFKLDEAAHLEEIINARKEAGRTNDWNHFIRQCIEFTVNNQDSWEFAVPKHLKNKIHFE